MQANITFLAEGAGLLEVAAGSDNVDRWDIIVKALRKNLSPDQVEIVPLTASLLPERSLTNCVVHVCIYVFPVTSICMELGNGK